MSEYAEIDNGIYRWQCFDPSITAVFTGRQISRDARSRLYQHLRIEESTCRFLKQEHTDRICAAEKGNWAPFAESADGWITDQENIPVAILTADCLPVFFAGLDHPFIGLVHAGWRGLHIGILKNAINEITRLYQVKPKQIKAAVGPAIRKCCYEVGSEFAGYFPASYRNGKMDMMSECVNQLSSLGIERNHIADSKICTVCSNHLFFSARKESGTKERMVSVMMRRPQ